jgi:hypothetical protein
MFAGCPSSQHHHHQPGYCLQGAASTTLASRAATGHCRDVQSQAPHKCRFRYNRDTADDNSNHCAHSSSCQIQQDTADGIPWEVVEGQRAAMSSQRPATTLPATQQQLTWGSEPTRDQQERQEPHAQHGCSGQGKLKRPTATMLHQLEPAHTQLPRLLPAPHTGAKAGLQPPQLAAAAPWATLSLRSATSAVQCTCWRTWWQRRVVCTYRGAATDLKEGSTQPSAGGLSHGTRE